MDYPNDKEVLETCECLSAVSFRYFIAPGSIEMYMTVRVAFSYSFKHIVKSMRALQASHKTSLRIDDDGLLSLQFLMPAPSKRNGPGSTECAFIEFRVSRLLDHTNLARATYTR